MRSATARTRCRVDLAGGTLDIWPLGLLHRGGRTVNLAVNLEVEVSMAPRTSGYRLDGGHGTPVLEVASLHALAARPEARLVAEVLSWLDLPPVEVRIRSASPQGAGLGGSSALTVALLAAGWSAQEQEPPPPLAIATVARDLEARLMSLPTGMQDHLPALMGGVLEILQVPGGPRVEPITTDLEELGRCLLVFYTGVSHFSAGANWKIVRRRLDGEEEVCSRLDRIAAIAAEMAEVLREGDLPRGGELLSREWEARRGLAVGVSTPELETLLAAGREAGAWGGKACGAGGGGCVALLASPQRLASVRQACVAAGGVPLAAEPTARGLELEL